LTSNGAEEARAVLRTLQELVDARDLGGLLELFAEGSVLIGTSGDGRDRAAVRRFRSSADSYARRSSARGLGGDYSMMNTATIAESRGASVSRKKAIPSSIAYSTLTAAVSLSFS
jgi:hypothetical protein